MNLKSFLTAAVLLSSTWSYNAKAGSIRINAGLVEGLAKLEDTSGLAAFFEKYGNSINSQMVTWSIDKESTPKTGHLYSLVFILCSKSLNANKQCESPQLIIETHHSPKTTPQPSSAKFVDEDGFLYSPPNTPDLSKSIRPYSYAFPEDITFISALAKLRLSNDPSLEKFYKKANTLPRRDLPSFDRIKNSDSSISYKVSELYTLRDYYSETPCGVHKFTFSADSKAEYSDEPLDHATCHPEAHTLILGF